MTRIQQSVEIHAPASLLYQRLSRFEDYPQFLDNVESVQQINDSRLRWTTKMANRPVEWEAEITKKERDRCIAWRGNEGLGNDCRIEVQALGPDSSKAVFTLETEAGQFPGLLAGDRVDEVKRHLEQALKKLKAFVEQQGLQSDERRQTAIRTSAASFSGSPTEVLEDEPDESGPENIGKDTQPRT